MIWVTATTAAVFCMLWLLERRSGQRAHAEAARLRSEALSLRAAVKVSEEMSAAKSKRIVAVVAECARKCRKTREEMRDAILSIEDPEIRARLAGDYALGGFEWLRDIENRDSD